MYFKIHTMLCIMENDVVDIKDSSSGRDILEQNFSQLPVEGRVLLKNYLQNLVSMQNTMAGTFSENDARSLSNGNRDTP